MGVTSPRTRLRDGKLGSPLAVQETSVGGGLAGGKRSLRATSCPEHSASVLPTCLGELLCPPLLPFFLIFRLHPVKRYITATSIEPSEAVIKQAMFFKALKS